MVLQNRLQRLGDENIVEIAQLGSLEAYEEPVRRFRGAVLLVAGQILNSRQAAEDVAQEAFLLAFQGLPQLQEPAKFPGWLYAITRRRAQRVALSEKRCETVEASVLERLATQRHSNAPDPLDAVLHAETREAVRNLLADLPPEIQIVLHLFYYQQWPAARIGAFLSLPLTTVKWRLHAGKRQLSPRITEFLEENTYVRTRPQKRDAPSVQPAPENGGPRRACRTDGQLRKRSAELREALQCDRGAP